MPKLTGYKEVAVIEIAGKDYHFAIYDDGQNYSAGDMVIVSGAARTDIREIKEIISIEAAETRCAKGITAEIISSCLLYTSIHLTYSILKKKNGEM